MSNKEDTRKLRRTPAESYRNDLDRNFIVEDTCQRLVVEHLENIFNGITGNDSERRPGFISRLLRGRRPYWKPVRGAYIWGDVGRGKTYLVDKFFECLW